MNASPSLADATVRRLVAAWEALDAEAVSSCFASDGVWHNIPYLPITGRAAIRAAAQAFLADKVSCQLEIAHAGEVSHGVIMNERVDVFCRQDGTYQRFPVVGVFEVGEDGLITVWRDYFDSAIMANQ